MNGTEQATPAPEVRQLTDHHDGFGLNDSIVIYTDDPDPNAGNGVHRYEASIGVQSIAGIQFQHGPRNVDGSTPGMTDRALLCILIDRLRQFQGGPYGCRENAIALTHLETANLWMDARTRDRARRGVLGVNAK